tara:strand:+ start:4106 stop:5182 length:1077 start_codon:yes stop_codon:yes gene_type:complete
MKKIFKLLLESTLIFLISFLIIDLVISNTFLNLKDKDCNSFEEYYLELKKNCEGKKKLKPNLPAISIFTDKEGMRIRENHKRTNKEKIFIFGSSFIFGEGVSYEKSVIGILENRHNKFEFYNFALPYGSPTYHLSKLREKINKQEIPKKIVLVLSMSDLLNEISVWGDYSENGKPFLLNDGIFKKSKKKEQFHKRNFRLSRSIALNIRDKIRMIRSEENNVKKVNKVRTTIQAGFTYLSLDQLENHYTEESFNFGELKIKKRVNEMQEISKRNNIQFFLAIFPFADTLEYGQQEYNWENYAKSLCSSSNCKLVNSFDDYNSFKENYKDWYKKLFFEGDEHFTELGHSILADKFTKQIF